MGNTYGKHLFVISSNEFTLLKSSNKSAMWKTLPSTSYTYPSNLLNQFVTKITIKPLSWSPHCLKPEVHMDFCSNWLHHRDHLCSLYYPFHCFHPVSVMCHHCVSSTTIPTQGCHLLPLSFSIRLRFYEYIDIYLHHCPPTHILFFKSRSQSYNYPSKVYNLWCVLCVKMK